MRFIQRVQKEIKKGEIQNGEEASSGRRWNPIGRKKELQDIKPWDESRAPEEGPEVRSDQGSVKMATFDM